MRSYSKVSRVQYQDINNTKQTVLGVAQIEIIRLSSLVKGVLIKKTEVFVKSSEM